MGVLFFESEIGLLKIAENDGFVTEINIAKEKGEDSITPLVLKARDELLEYFEGKRKEFTFPVKFEGTDFQNAVWRELLKIPYGKTVSYFDIAKGVNNEKALRAVGTAVGKNKLLIVVPCHRVINKNGSLGGFACGLEVKKKLLKIENII